MKFKLLTVLFLLPLISFSQQETGRIRYLVVHNWTKKMEAVDYISDQRKERAAYMWGSRSEWKSYCELFFDGSKTKYQESEEDPEPNRGSTYNWRKDTYYQTRDYDKNTLLDGINARGKDYVIEDKLPVLDWKIKNDMKEVAGHICMNAVRYDSLRYQTVEAWFALDMPLPAGPDRFYGLPGTILEVNVNNGAMVISADLIEYKEVDEEMKMPKKLRGKKVDLAGYHTVLAEFIAERRKAEEPFFWGIRY